VDQPERVADGVVGAERDRRVEQGVSGLHVVDHGLDDVERDVLRQHRQPTASRDRLGHPSTGDRRHVRDHDRDLRAERIRRREVDVEA
jgi:hypothetical protein